MRIIDAIAEMPQAAPASPLLPHERHAEWLQRLKEARRLEASLLPYRRELMALDLEERKRRIRELLGDKAELVI